MRRQAEPRLGLDEQARLKELGWKVDQPHQPMPIEEPGTAETLRNGSGVLSIADNGPETEFEVAAPEDLLRVRR